MPELDILSGLSGGGGLAPDLNPGLAEIFGLPGLDLLDRFLLLLRRQPGEGVKLRADISGWHVLDGLHDHGVDLIGAADHAVDVARDWVKRLLPKSEGRVRRLARVYPYGMDKPLTVFGLLPPENECPNVTDQMIADYDAALDAAIEGQWDKATQLLEPIPESDGSRRFLQEQIIAARLYSGGSWDGAFRLSSK